jgi:hypothetical protein
MNVIEGVYINSQNEKVSIQKLTSGNFEGQFVLILWDDPPPNGSGVAAPTLLDEGMRKWLLEHLNG